MLVRLIDQVLFVYAINPFVNWDSMSPARNDWVENPSGHRLNGLVALNQ